VDELELGVGDGGLRDGAQVVAGDEREQVGEQAFDVCSWRSDEDGIGG
jgi:hypothetical protein